MLWGWDCRGYDTVGGSNQREGRLPRVWDLLRALARRTEAREYASSVTDIFARLLRADAGRRWTLWGIYRDQRLRRDHSRYRGLVHGRVGYHRHDRCHGGYLRNRGWLAVRCSTEGSGGTIRRDLYHVD